MCGAVTESVSSSVVSVWLSPDGKYGFVEVLTSDMATVALALNGIQMRGASLKISKPNTYTSSSSVSASFGMAGMGGAFGMP